MATLEGLIEADNYVENGPRERGLSTSSVSILY